MQWQNAVNKFCNSNNWDLSDGSSSNNDLEINHETTEVDLNQVKHL